MKATGLCSPTIGRRQRARLAGRAAALIVLLGAAGLHAPVWPDVDAQGAEYLQAAAWPIAASAFGTPDVEPSEGNICGRFAVATMGPPEYTIFYDRDGIAYLTALCADTRNNPSGFGRPTLIAFDDGGQGAAAASVSQFGNETAFENSMPMLVNAYDPVRHAVYGAWQCCWALSVRSTLLREKGAIALLEMSTGRMDRGRIWNTYAPTESAETEEVLALAVDGQRGVVAASESGLTSYRVPRTDPAPKQVTDTHGVAFVPGWLVAGRDGSFYGIQRTGAGGVTRLDADLNVDPRWQLETDWPDLGPLASYHGSDSFYVVEGGHRAMSIRVFGADGRTIRRLPIPSAIVAYPRPQLAVGPDGRYAVLGHDEGGRLLWFMLSPTGDVWRSVVVKAGDVLTALGGRTIETRPQLQIEGRSTLVRSPKGYESLVLDGAGSTTAVLQLPPDTFDALLTTDGDVILRRGRQRGVATVIERIAVDGTVRWSTETSGAASASGGLAAVDGALAVVLGDGSQIESIDAATGDHLVRDEIESNVADIASGPNGALYVLRGDGGAVQVLLPDRRAWDRTPGTLLSGQSMTSVPIALAVGRDGRIAVAYRSAADAGSPSSEAIVYDGTGSQRWRLPTSWFSGQDATVEDLGFDADGRLLVYASAADDAAPRGHGTVFVFAPRDPLVTATPPAAPPGATPTVTPTPAAANAGRCRIGGDKWAAPTEVELGEAVTVTLTLTFDCPPMPDVPSDIMLVLDRTGSMVGSDLEMAKETVRSILDVTDTSQHRVGLVSFGISARVDVRLTRDKASIIDRLDHRASGMTSVTSGLNLAYGHLRANGRPGVAKTLVVITDGGHNTGADPRQASQRIHESGGVVYAVAIGDNANHELLMAIAGSRDRFIVERTSQRLRAAVESMMRKAYTPRAHGRLTDVMSPDVTLVRSPIAPAPDVVSPSTVGWYWSVMPSVPVTMTYRVEPNRTGEMPTNTVAYVDYLDVDGIFRRYVYPIPRIRVPEPDAPTATRTPSPTPSPPPTPTDVVVRPRPRLYLPLALREPACAPEERRVDVALVIDASVSMLDATVTGRTKLAAALGAAEQFVGRLQLGRGDQVSIIGFNSAAVLHQPLTSDADAVARGLRAIAPSSMTCILCGVETAAAELGSARRRPDHTPVLILLTDGRANPGPIDAAVTAAAVAKANGIVIYTIGLGHDVETEALTAMASKPDKYLFAPDGEQLAAVYAQIAADLPCPDTNWPRSRP